MRIWFDHGERAGQSVRYVQVKDNVLRYDRLPRAFVYQLKLRITRGRSLKTETLDATRADPSAIGGERAINKLKHGAVIMGFPLVPGSRIALQRNDELLANPH